MDDTDELVQLVQATMAWKKAQGRDPVLSLAEWKLWNATESYERTLTVSRSS